MKSNNNNHYSISTSLTKVFFKNILFLVVSLSLIHPLTAETILKKHYYSDYYMLSYLPINDPDVVVAVIDYGVDFSNPLIADYQWVNEDEIEGNGIDDDGNGYIDDRYGWDFENNDNDPSPDDGETHGTKVAGVISADQDVTSGYQGLANVKIMNVKADIFNHEKDGNAIRYAVDNGAKIINASWGLMGLDMSFVEEAIEYALANDVIFVTSAGNHGFDLDVEPNYPAAYPDVITVTGTTNGLEIDGGFDYGSMVDFAVQAQVSTVKIGSGTTGGTGTSFASPAIAAIAARIRAFDPSLSKDEVISLMGSHATVLADGGSDSGYGYINMKSLVNSLITATDRRELVTGPDGEVFDLLYQDVYVSGALTKSILRHVDYPDGGRLHLNEEL